MDNSYIRISHKPKHPAWLKCGQATIAAIAFLFAVFLISQPFAHADPPDSYGVLKQAGSYAEKQNALALVKRFQKGGKVAFIVEKVVRGRTFYAVVVDHKPATAAPYAETPDTTGMDAMDTGGDIYFTPKADLPIGVLPLYNGKSGPSIALKIDTTIYNSPSPEAAPLGTYLSVGGGQYIGKHDGFYSLWLPVIKKYGFIKARDTQEAEYVRDRIIRATDGSGKIILPTLSGAAGSSIALHAKTLVYESSTAGARVLWTYAPSLSGRYSEYTSGFYSIWFPNKLMYGYVSQKDASAVEFSPAENLDK